VREHVYNAAEAIQDQRLRIYLADRATLGEKSHSPLAGSCSIV
jgi:hypothetical protein